MHDETAGVNSALRLGCPAFFSVLLEDLRCVTLLQYWIGIHGSVLSYCHSEGEVGQDDVRRRSLRQRGDPTRHPKVHFTNRQSPEVLRAQLFALTGVEPDRQKLMIKGKTVKVRDESYDCVLYSRYFHSGRGHLGTARCEGWQHDDDDGDSR